MGGDGDITRRVPISASSDPWHTPVLPERLSLEKVIILAFEENG